MANKCYSPGRCQLCGTSKMPFIPDTQVTEGLEYLRLVCFPCRRKEKSRVHSNNTGRRMRRQTSRHNVRYSEWMQILVASKFACRKCGKRGREHLSMDHVLPIAQGGTNGIKNVQPLCKTCHAHKDNSPPNRFRAIKTLYRKFRFWVQEKTGLVLPYPLFFKGNSNTK